MRLAGVRMSTEKRSLADVTPGGNIAKVLLHKYGLGTLFAANVLGAGSIYILAQTGASVGFALLWVLPLAFAVDMVMHDLSARMATHNQPLMEYIRSVIGDRPAQMYAVTMALVMQLWAVANYAVSGAALSWFTGLSVDTSIIIMAGIGAVLISIRKYKSVESVVATMMFVVFVAYASLTFGLDMPMRQVMSGFVPGSVAQPALIIAMLGTTVYYPNFFIQSSMQPTKLWTDLRKYRRDNAVGIGIAVLVSAGMLSVAAVALNPGELTLTEPAVPLVEMVGLWALPVFMVAVLAASFTSATGTLFGSSFAVPQSFGHDTEFGDSAFSAVTLVLITLSATLAIWALENTALTPVRMAIIMPALNGAIYLPVTLLAMYSANRHRIGLKQKMVTALAIAVLFAGSLLTAESLYMTVVGWL